MLLLFEGEFHLFENSRISSYQSSSYRESTIFLIQSKTFLGFRNSIFLGRYIIISFYRRHFDHTINILPYHSFRLSNSSVPIRILHFNEVNIVMFVIFLFFLALYYTHFSPSFSTFLSQY